jgi:hypothetical protein
VLDIDDRLLCGLFRLLLGKLGALCGLFGTLELFLEAPIAAAAGGKHESAAQGGESGDKIPAHVVPVLCHYP